jgi:hypothetical protein
LQDENKALKSELQSAKATLKQTEKELIDIKKNAEKQQQEKNSINFKTHFFNNSDF